MEETKGRATSPLQHGVMRPTLEKRKLGICDRCHKNKKEYIAFNHGAGNYDMICEACHLEIKKAS